MFQKDFILRMIEMMGELIAALLGLIKKGNLEEAAEALENAYHDFLKEDAAFFYAIPKEKLTEKLLQEHNYTRGHLEILSELFYAEAELLFAKDKKAESLVFYEKSLILKEFVINESKTFSFDKQSRIEEIRRKIELIK